MLFPKAELGNAQLPVLDATEEAKLSILPAITQSRYQSMPVNKTT
jgi:hypothetical protein